MWVYAVASDCRLVFYSRLHRTILQVGYLTTIKRAWTIQLLVCFGKVGMIKGPQQEFLFTDREGRLLEWRAVWFVLGGLDVNICEAQLNIFLCVDLSDSSYFWSNLVRHQAKLTRPSNSWRPGQDLAVLGEACSAASRFVRKIPPSWTDQLWTATWCSTSE